MTDPHKAAILAAWSQMSIADRLRVADIWEPLYAAVSDAATDAPFSFSLD